MVERSLISRSVIVGLDFKNNEVLKQILFPIAWGPSMPLTLSTLTKQDAFRPYLSQGRHVRTLATWLDDYGRDHTHPINRKLHKVCVPLIFWTVIGLLHLIPMRIGDVVIALMLVWYIFLGSQAFVVMLAQTFFALVVTEALQMTLPVFWILIAVFIVAWVGQFYGHHLEGRRPSFLRDLQYLLIGPLWIWLGKPREPAKE